MYGVCVVFYGGVYCVVDFQDRIEFGFALGIGLKLIRLMENYFQIKEM